MANLPDEAFGNDPDHARLLGRDIRSLRKNRGWTLAILAGETGCSVGYLSEVERGTRTISIKFLRAIAKQFDVPLGWFFTHEDQPNHERGYIVRAKNRKRIGNSEDGLIEELLSPDLSGSFEMFLTQMEPGSTSNGTIFRDVEEEGFIMKGQLQLTIEGICHVLKIGDSFRIDRKKFSWKNSGKTETSVLWVTSPPVY